MDYDRLVQIFNFGIWNNYQFINIKKFIYWTFYIFYYVNCQKRLQFSEYIELRI